MIKVGIVGSEGFMVGELIALLINHEDVVLEKVYAPEHVGEMVSHIHPGLFNFREIVFTDNADFSELEVLFVCLNSARAKAFYSSHILPESLKVIDFSYELRPLDEQRVAKTAELCSGREFVYGLPEMNRRAICNASSVSVPGSFANSVIVGLIPLAKHLLMNSELHVSSVIGHTENAARPQSTAIHYDSMSDRITLYHPFEHRQTKEMEYALKCCQNSFTQPINFLPIRGNFVRGTYACTYFDIDVSLDEIKKFYREHFDDHSFVYIQDTVPDIRQVVNTNYSIIHLMKYGRKLMVVSVQDNLLKGGAGTAVHIMNLMCGLVETTGLKLKPVTY
ncbi:hypothetical protein HQ39_01060 [Porphyromonas sp. COT-108 OH2963]|uniref:hypothetical protein n=1 Tax=Porphyromonas sp. COT-108 OH2963 TaxID=1515614 RepID=UPI00052E0ECC|nr:hypothetical protein [Porphyromonas sp. COT-108 OH2963]KGN96671.1 hypothetical protein HQ39_01060 [Porphyromonas sp. COT-108 OH2963]